MASNEKQFNLEIAEFAKKLVPEKFNQFKRKIALQALRGVVVGTRTASTPGTPVGNSDLWEVKPKDRYVGGSARGNWQVTTGIPASSISNAIDPTGTGTIGKGTARLMQIGAPTTPIFITNNLPYIKALEDGHSTQAPMGMVALTVAAINLQFRKVKDF